MEFCGWAVENIQKMPLLEGVGPVPVGVFAGLQEWSCPCGGFPAVPQGLMVGWTWPKKIKALHLVDGSSRPMRARSAA